MDKEKLMGRFNTGDIKEDVDGGQKDSNENGKYQKDSKVSSSRHDDKPSNVYIKQEIEQEEKVLINTEQQQIDNRGQSTIVGRCTKVKKDEESGEVKLEWNGDECDCEQCRVEREIKIEFNQTNATNERVKGSLGPFKKGAPFQCKRVKKEEDDDAEWDEDCDCHDCRTMRLKDMRLKQTNATENGGDGGDDGGNDGNETDFGEECDLVGNDGKLDEANSQRDDGSKSGEVKMSEDDETEIDDEEYETNVDGDKSSDEETEVDEQESDDLSTQNVVRTQVIHNNSRKNKYVCEHCGKGLRTPFLLNSHIRTHTGEKPFKCSWKDCNKGFSEKHSLQTHYMRHTGEKPFRCTWKGCNMTFSNQGNAQRHHRVHNGKKTFKCPWKDCEKAFVQKVNMQKHQRIHTREKNFKCPWEGCDKSFTQQSSAKSHYIIHTEKKPFKCPWKDCDKAFSAKWNMRIHHKLHTPELLFKCEHCDKGFQERRNLNQHIRTHAGQKPYKCPRDDCARAFSSKSNLNKHLKTHTE